MRQWLSGWGLPNWVNVRRWCGCSLAVVIAAMSGCAVQDTTTAVTQLINHQQCQQVNSGVTLVNQNALMKIRPSRLLAEPGQAQGPQVPEGTGLILAISRGSQPTPGYGFTLMGSSLTRDGGLSIELTWQEPDPTAMQAQVLTHPCLVVAVPATTAEQMQFVQVQDNRGTVGRMDLPQ